MLDDTPTGIPNPDMPGHWLVPPWPTDATFSDVVRHFNSHHLLRSTNTAHLAAYFEGFRAALEAAPAGELTDALYQRWSADMRDCVSRCARLYREELMTTRHIPALQEKAS